MPTDEVPIEVLKKNPPKFKEGHLLLSGDRVFYTIQGEGPSIGCSAIFVRLHMCNLECDWSNKGGEICDAWYTWKKDTREYWTEHGLMSFEELIDKINNYPTDRIIFTGGEPLMQQNNIAEFINTYRKFIFSNYEIEIETNGTYEITNDILLDFILKSKVQINCSPKLSSSGNPINKTIVPKVLQQYNQFPLSYFKFVVNGAEDIEEIDKIVSEQGLFNNKVVLMPQGTSLDNITGDSMLSLVEVAMARGWRVTPRLQCELWGNKRGV